MLAHLIRWNKKEVALKSWHGRAQDFLLSGEILVQSSVQRIPLREEAWETAGGFALGEASGVGGTDALH